MTQLAARNGLVTEACDDTQAAAAEPAAYLFKVMPGPTWTPDEFDQTLRLLSQRFTGELWSNGGYAADTTFGRMRLRVLRDRSRLRFLNYLHYARAVWRRARELRSTPPLQPVVVTSFDPFLGGLLAWRVARLLGGSFVCEVNGAPADPDSFADVKSAAWTRIRLLQMRLLGSFVLRRADAVRLLFDEQLDRFVTLRPGTVVRRFWCLTHPERFYEGPDEPFILSAGYPFRRKGVDTLVRAFTRIAAEFPDWKLVLIGHLVPQQLQACGMQHPQITALAGMPQKQLLDWMSRCSIFALASRSEGTPRVLIEAAAAGKCRISTRICGIPLIIAHGKDGMLVEKDDVEGLAAELRTLMRDERLRHRLAVEGQRRIAQEFSGPVYLAHFEELICATLQASENGVAARV